MARTTGVSHMFAAFLSLVSGKLLMEYLHPVFPGIIDTITKYSEHICFWIQQIFGININPEVAVPTITGLFIAFLWGYIFHKARAIKR